MPESLLTEGVELVVIDVDELPPPFTISSMLWKLTLGVLFGITVDANGVEYVSKLLIVGFVDSFVEFNEPLFGVEHSMSLSSSFSDSECLLMGDEEIILIERGLDAFSQEIFCSTGFIFVLNY